ncbi:MAG: hypothetical protein AB7O97_02945 [Planctomycetota bacterium]
MNRPLAPWLALALSLLTPPPAAAQDPGAPEAGTALDPTLLAGLRARSIGPAAMSGRIGAVASVPGDPQVVWVGAASGGVWKSTDGGATFAPVFDDQDCTSIGAIAIDPRSSDVVWVGSGEGNPRNSASVGRGIYRTRDGGRHWDKLGLERTEHIHRVVLDPRDPDTVFAAAFGTSWGENEERGLYRTRDGGATWERILFVDAKTGCCDVVMDPQNPDKLFAAMWDHRRTAWDFRSGGPGSGLYRSLDGGDSWQRLEPHDGVPKGDLGKACFAIAASDPRVVYCLVEAEKSALLRSDDGGFSFRTVHQDGIAPRPFYFCDIRVDPRDPNRVYNMHVVVDVSTDGGRTFAQLVGWGDAHPDHHSMWIDPFDPRRIVLGNDGGVYTSLDRGGSWRFCSNLPLAQFYHCAVDDDVPYHVYGGLQDNGSWRGPQQLWENGGIRNLHWQEVCFGDGFATLPDPEDSTRGYAMSQGGSLIRWNVRTGERKSIRPPAPDGVELRWQWNAGIAQDPFDPATIWYGSQFVHRSKDRGESWEIVSPDLTTDNPAWQQQDKSGGLSIDATGAENHCTILTIAPSPVQRGVVWVGTDDGRVQVTQDDGRSWTSVEDRIEGLPRNTWCPHIEAGKFAAGSAYAVFDDHRRANWTPYVYRTDDFGQTWRSLATPALDGYCLAIEQDPVREDLLFLGTEFGLWFTIDGGASWHRWKHGVPTCSAMALVVQPTQGDLVVGTHGRSMYVLDDLQPLRALTPEILQQKLHLFPVRPAIAWVSKQTPAARFPGTGEFRGDNLTRGALLHVICTADQLAHPDAEVERARKKAKGGGGEDAKASEPGAGAEGGGEAEAADPDAPAAAEPAAKPADDGAKVPDDHVVVEVRDAQGTLVRTFREKVHLGLNRVVWRFERDGEPGPQRELRTQPPETPPRGREVLPGDYTVTVRFQGEERSTPVRVLADPREDVPMADREAKDRAQQRAQEILRPLTDATQRLARARREIELVKDRLALDPKPRTGDDPFADLRKAHEAVTKELEAAEERLWGKRVEQGILRGQGLASETFQQLGALNDTPDAPNATELLALDRAEQKVQQATAAVQEFVDGPLAVFRAAVEQSTASLVPGQGR